MSVSTFDNNINHHDRHFINSMCQKQAKASRRVQHVSHSFCQYVVSLKEHISYADR